MSRLAGSVRGARVWTALAVVAGVLLAAAPRRSRPVLTPSQVATQIESLVERRGARAIRWGVCVARVDTGEVLCDYRADELFMPASNRKLFVTALALDRLGADFRFATPLYADAPVSTGGVLRGNLTVRGTGDPTFLNPRFHRGSMVSTLQEWAELLAARGVRRIEGDLVMDCSGFASGEECADGWIKDYETAEYAPRVSALCIATNRVTVNIRPAASPGKAPAVSLLPPNSAIQLLNHAVTGTRRSADTITISRADDGPDRLIIAGKIPCGGEEQSQRVPMERAALVAGEVFRSVLQKKGITVAGGVRAPNGDRPSSPPLQAVPFGQYLSPPLREILALTNKHSDNYCAEQLFQAVTFAKVGRTSYPQAKKYEEQFLAEVGILPSAANFEDGSGLSRLNLVAPRAVVALLGHMAHHKEGQAFLDSLAIAGRDGTLAGRMGNGARGKVRAKTGCLSMASCLSGYAETRSGVLVAFSILANECPGRISEACSVQDRICEWLVNTEFE